MADSIISVFGSYDFYGKSLPGMAMVVGVALLLPEGAIPVPELSENFLVLISILIIIAILGTLIGEVVHAFANLFEQIVNWLGARTRGLLIRGAESAGIEFRPRDPIIVQARDHGDDGDTSGLALHRRAWSRIRGWLYRRYTNTVYVLWSHRTIFHKRLTEGLNRPFQDIELPVPDVPFNRQHLIKVAIDEYNMKDSKDSNEVYPVVVSTVEEHGGSRPFLFQTRATYCRSMWVVLLFFSIAFWLAFFAPEWIVPSALHYTSYFTEYLMPDEAGLLVMIMFIMSLIFANTSGKYKKYYIEYLFSEMYVIHQFDQGNARQGS